MAQIIRQRLNFIRRKADLVVQNMIESRSRCSLEEEEEKPTSIRSFYYAEPTQDGRMTVQIEIEAIGMNDVRVDNGT